jgi:hypothetical protein
LPPSLITEAVNPASLRIDESVPVEIVRLGKTYGTLMVDLWATNSKLPVRACRLWEILTGSAAARATLRTARTTSGFKAGLCRRGTSGPERGWKMPQHLQARVASSPNSPGCCFS